MVEERKAVASYPAYEKIRTQKGVTDYAVAQATGVATATISSWKSGVYAPKIDKLMAIAQYLDVPIESLLASE